MKSYKFIVNVLILITLMFVGCSARTKKSATVPAEQEQMGPFPDSAISPPSQISDSNALGPMPEPGFIPPNDGYVLVLGPGYARTLGFVGVLRVFEENHVPIKAIVGVEMGALIGTIWATSSSNFLEWEIHKFHRADLLDVPLLGLRDSMALGKKYLKFLDGAIKIDDLKHTKIPVTVVSNVVGAGQDGVLVESAGSAKNILRGAIGLNTILRPHTWNSIERESSVLDQPMPVAIAKKLGLGRVVCVDSVGDGEGVRTKEGVDARVATIMRSVAGNIRRAMSDCDFIISINAMGVGYLDFDSKANLIYQGKIAAQKWLEQNK